MREVATILVGAARKEAADTRNTHLKQIRFVLFNEDATALFQAQLA